MLSIADADAALREREAAEDQHERGQREAAADVEPADHRQRGEAGHDEEQHRQPALGFLADLPAGLAGRLRHVRRGQQQRGGRHGHEQCGDQRPHDRLLEGRTGHRVTSRVVVSRRRGADERRLGVRRVRRRSASVTGRRRASWPASGGDRIGLDCAHVPAVAVHDGQLVAQRPLDAGVVGGGDLDGHAVAGRLRDRAHRADLEDAPSGARRRRAGSRSASRLVRSPAR